jgi:hypothetical protein
MSKTKRIAKVTFGALGQATPNYDSNADVLFGANLGVGQLIGSIERYIRWERDGSSRAERAVPGSQSFSLQAYVPELESLEGQDFKSLYELRDAIRALMEVK